MKKILFLLVAFAALILSGTSANAQKFKPKSIVFEGAPDYTNKELLTAAELTPGAVLDSSDMKGRAKLLMDSGAFSGITFTFDGEVLKYKLVQSDDLYSIRWGNIPFPVSDEIIAKIRAKAPLFHGKVPYDGTILDSVKDVIKGEFLAHGVNAEISASPYSEQDSHTVVAMEFSIVSPPVLIGEMQYEGVSPGLADALQVKMKNWHGAQFNADDTANSIHLALENFYSDLGYAGASFNIKKADKPVFSAAKIEIPYTVQVNEGKLYKLGKISLPSGVQFTADEMHKVLGLKEGDPPKSENLRGLWWAIGNKYKNQGYLTCKVEPKKSLDEANAIANYDVQVETGPVFYMGTVSFKGFPDDMTGALYANWGLQPGMVFDLHYVSSFLLQFIAKNKQYAPLQFSSKLNYSLSIDSKTHSVAVNYRRE